jgi:hypothetical protein
MELASFQPSRAYILRKFLYLRSKPEGPPSNQVLNAAVFYRTVSSFVSFLQVTLESRTLTDFSETFLYVSFISQPQLVCIHVSVVLEGIFKCRRAQIF